MFFSIDLTVMNMKEIGQMYLKKMMRFKAYWDREIETGRIKRAIIFIGSLIPIFNYLFRLRCIIFLNEDKLMYSRVDRLAQSYQHFINKSIVVAIKIL